MTDDFARVYEMTANRITGPVAVEALKRVGGVKSGARVLDVGAGTGALAIPAAFSGAHVLAVDHAPGMIDLLSDRIAAFPDAKADLMDGQALKMEDDSFDFAFSIFGVILFDDWRRGLSEMARVVRRGGKGCVATWKTLPGGGPFVVMGRALRTLFPDRMPPAPPEGLVVLSDPVRLAAEMQSAGFTDVAVTEVDALWTGPAGTAYLDEMAALHGYMAPYALLDGAQRSMVHEVILEIIEEFSQNGRTELPATALIATGTKTL
ncbi:class I SAM-dependent methyltransferase [Neorhizobium sp. NPDC001467]|uniref:class I SAM-dependent methyltransferase n=1 Tax=Neorhizobium sp. NPDC001467 TaxID=3390595 RepID=UPI003D08D3D8